MHVNARTVRLSALLSLLTLCSLPGSAQTRRGRKYKPPPETSHIEVLVTKQSNGKPIQNAAVVFHPIKDGHDEGNLEVKTDPEGKAMVDVIPTGSTVRVQVIANGYATFAEDFEVADASKSIAVGLLRPQEQVSAYQENGGKESTRKAGVQEPVKRNAPRQSATPPKPPPPPPPAGETPAPATVQPQP